MSESQASSSGSANAHLSYPSYDSESATPVASSSQQKQLHQDRLYIGNLHHSVDEYSLLQVFSKFGKISHLDFLFHKTGTLKGKPRGYAFVQYANKDDALKALTMANEKLLRGRKLVVTYAHQAPLDQGGSFGGSKARKGVSEAGRPTALSLLKSTGGGSGRSDGTKNKIAMMEAKLRQMERTPATASTSKNVMTPTASKMAPKPAPVNFNSTSGSLLNQSIFPRQDIVKGS